MLERRVERYREGDIVYPLQNHIVIIGLDVYKRQAFIYGETDLSQIPLQAKIAPGHQKDAVAFLESLHNDNADGAFN